MSEIRSIGRARHPHAVNHQWIASFVPRYPNYHQSLEHSLVTPFPIEIMTNYYFRITRDGVQAVRDPDTTLPPPVSVVGNVNFAELHDEGPQALSASKLKAFVSDSVKSGWQADLSEAGKRFFQSLADGTFGGDFKFPTLWQAVNQPTVPQAAALIVRPVDPPRPQRLARNDNNASARPQSASEQSSSTVTPPSTTILAAAAGQTTGNIAPDRSALDLAPSAVDVGSARAETEKRTFPLSTAQSVKFPPGTLLPYGSSHAALY